MLNPAYPIERERRWLVREYDLTMLSREDQQEIVLGSQEITQGYFEVLGERSFRVRLIKDCRGERAVVTSKEGSGEVRTEREEPIELPAARVMLDATSYQVQKRRHFVPNYEGSFGGSPWELDEFEGSLKGIVLLEFEAKGDEPFPPLPPWIIDAIDVTDSLTNLHLARMAKEISNSVDAYKEISGDVNEHVSRFLEPKLPKIVLTGGPCSGKSTLMREMMEKYGDRVHCVPEVATILIAQVGMLPSVTDEKHNAQFQQILYRVQRSFEEAAELQAIKDGKQAIVLDRGTIDAIAYLQGEDNLKRQANFTLATGLRVRSELDRYMQVIFLNPPSREVFEANRENNPARKETYAQMLELALRTSAAWSAPGYAEWRYIHLTNIDGETWDAKRDAAFKVLDNYVSY